MVTMMAMMTSWRKKVSSGSRRKARGISRSLWNRQGRRHGFSMGGRFRRTSGRHRCARPDGSFVAYFYSLADQLFASINGLRYHIRKAGSFWGGIRMYFHDPVMVSSFTIVTLPFAGIFLVRVSGWRPDTLVLVAVEGILLNLCWIPPLTAWVWDWRLQRGLRAVSDRTIERMSC